MTDLDALERLEKAATPGPWSVATGQAGRNGWCAVRATDEPRGTGGYYMSEQRIFDDGSADGEYGKRAHAGSRDFVVALVNAFPELIAELRHARAYMAKAPYAVVCPIRGNDLDAIPGDPSRPFYTLDYALECANNVMDEASAKELRGLRIRDAESLANENRLLDQINATRKLFAVPGQLFMDAVNKAASELRELRAYRVQVERVKACAVCSHTPGWVGDNKCYACEGLP